MNTEHGQIRVGVGVMVVRDGKVLLGRRHHKTTGFETWSMPGGGVEFGEELEVAAARELFEECGLMVELTDLHFISLGNEIAESRQFITIGFLAERVFGQPQVKEPQILSEWKWYSLNDLPSPIFSPSQTMLNNYQQHKTY